MLYEESDESIVAMKIEPMKPRTGIGRCWGRLGEDKTRPMRRGSGLERVDTKEQDNTGLKERESQKGSCLEGQTRYLGNWMKVCGNTVQG